MALNGERARLDAHAHFFFPGFVETMPASCKRQSPDEITLYQAYAEQHNIEQVLAIGYEGAQWALGNNRYLAGLNAQHPWVRPLAFVMSPASLSLEQLTDWQRQGFVGITCYLFSSEHGASLQQVKDDVWKWLVDRAWLISINSTGEHWASWVEILERHPQLRLLIAHLGLPPAATGELSREDATRALTSVCALARYPQTFVKFSGFYALAQPNYAFPHQASWPYAQVIHETFGAARILWASDFSPALEFVSFPQTVAVVDLMPWFSDDERRAIVHDNLSHLLHSVDERKGRP